MAYTYASEADILNMALFGKTAAQWRNEKGIKGKTPNIRDFAFLHCAAVFQTKPYLKYPLHLSLISDVLFKWLIGTICGIETPPLYDLIVPCVQ